MIPSPREVASLWGETHSKMGQDRMRTQRVYHWEKAENDLTDKMAFGLSLEEGVGVCYWARKQRRKGIPDRGSSPCKGIFACSVSSSLLGTQNAASDCGS